MARGRVVLLAALAVVLCGAVAALGWIGHRAWRLAHDPMGVLGGVRLVYSVDFEHPWEAGRTRAELLRRSIDCLIRRANGANASASVRASGHQIEVLLPANDRALPVDVTKKQLSRSGRVEFRRVDVGSPAMTELVARLVHEPQPGAGSDVERWTDAGGGAEHYDLFLTGDTRERLEAAIRALTSGRPLAPDHELLVERRASDWRSYYVFREVFMDNADVKEAEVSRLLDEPRVVLLEFADDGQRFAALTSRAVHKIAIVFEGQIVSAAAVQGPIRSRHARIALGGGDEQPADVEPKDLVAMLGMSGLPAPVVLVREESVSPTP